ncbi:MAG: ANTAR domain-containing protein [Streptosporangiales bacterium]|nr:ANTAR domain-containing protein [Streptosporangiales bacterium]
MARDIGSLGRVDEGSLQHALYRVAAVAARGIPGCACAVVTIWRDDAIVESAASHADLTETLEHPYGSRGPTTEARRLGISVYVADMLREERWPGFATAAVRQGIRSGMIFAFPLERDTLTLGLYAPRPRSFDAATAGPLALLLAEQVTVALRNTGRYTSAMGEAVHMRRALSSRAIIDQAKGIIMHARGCDAETAFGELRRVSQRSQMKVADVARKLVAEHAAANARR